ncbi:MAG: FHA domain-containing protein [Syntrophobacteraceae bacterium]
MPVLTLKFEDKLLEERTLLDGESVTIGRRAANDVVIDNLGVSSTHARIDFVDGGFQLTDLQSKNGSFVNGRIVSSCRLHDGDVITIGKHTLVFAYAPGEAPARDASDFLEQTLVIGAEDYNSALNQNYQPGKSQELNKETVGVLTYLAGGQGEIRLTRKLTKIGKDPDADIPVAGFLVGKIAATISNRPTGYYLSYVGGMAKPRVNGAVVKESVKLEEFDVIEVGSAKIQLTYQFIYKK